jgi:hypothetical protein
VKWEKDPQYILEQLLSRVILLKSKKGELLHALTENLRKIQSTQFRGSTDSSEIILESKAQADYNEYGAGLIDYAKDLTAKINSTKKRINALESAYSKGLFNESEYNHEKEELESISGFFTDLSTKAKDTLSRVTE